MIFIITVKRTIEGRGCNAFGIFCIRCGALQPEDLENEYEEDIDFLFARLKLMHDDEEVNTSVYITQI